jgi:hypothetical protein
MSTVWVALVLLPAAVAVITVWFGGGPSPLPLLPPPHDVMTPKVANEQKHWTIIKSAYALRTPLASTTTSTATPKNPPEKRK